MALMMEAASTSETSINYQTTRRNNPEDSYLHTKLCFPVSSVYAGIVMMEFCRLTF
jgi:hypothetical protein